MITIKTENELKEMLDENKNLLIDDDIKITFNIEENVIRNISCKKIKCNNIDCGDIDCGDIDCWDIECGDISCNDIDCGDIKCGNIKCWNIKCWNIDYNTFCFARRSFICRAVKGRKANSMHKCLDNKIKYI